MTFPRAREISRLWPDRGYTEAELETLEQAAERPRELLTDAPVLLPSEHRLFRYPTIALNVEVLYWGVREMIRQITLDTKRMTIADSHLQNLERQSKV